MLVVPLLALGFAFAMPQATVAAVAEVTCDPNNPTINTGAQCAQGDQTSSSLFGDGGIFKTITNVLLFIIGAIGVIMLIIGGIRYTISNGDSGAVTSAKNTIMYAVIGIIVAILAYAIVNFVLTSFVSTT
jgi:multisubunit Na+/H+ antiporter MnhB subunit